ncbi:hypothetical protein [Nonomuraea sp. CA-141351]|uniref:hypothetical protein n=1 Tax=Nonomuraea sp. CA-141351 TaxID=3239996 RepID=UPI003D8D4182
MNRTVAELIARAGLPDDADLKTTLRTLTWHVTTPLKNVGIDTIGALAARAEAELLQVPQFGLRRLDMLKAALAALPPRSPRSIAIDDDCEVRVFDPDPDQGDVSRMYVMEAHGVSMLVYVRNDGSGTYVHVENEGIPPEHGPLLVEVNNSGENTYDVPGGEDSPPAATFHLQCAACEHDCTSSGNYCIHCGRLVDGRWVFPLWPDREKAAMPDHYGWLITRDYRHEAQHPDCPDAPTCLVDACGMGGPADEMTQDISDRLHIQREGLPFRLFDGDGTLCFEGRLIVPEGQEDGPALFAPLDAAKKHAGCTTIAYADEHGEWRPL